jgi:hypothetical protein
VPAKSLQLGEVNPPVLGGVHGAALETVFAEARGRAAGLDDAGDRAVPVRLAANHVRGPPGLRRCREALVGQKACDVRRANWEERVSPWSAQKAHQPAL